MQYYLVSALVFSLIVAIFAIQNTVMVTVQFLTMQASVSLVLVILGSAVVGALALFFLSLFRQVGSWMTIRQLTHQKEELEKQVKRLEEKLSHSDQPVQADSQLEKEEVPESLTVNSTQ